MEVQLPNIKNMRFRVKVFEVVKNISKGSFLSYKEVAKRAGNPKAYRLVAKLMAKNQNLKVPCHRVIKNNNEIGGYRGSYRNTWQKIALLLKEGAIGVIPTDTIYGICGSALNKKTVERIYALRKRKPEKPMIILIFSLNDLKKFEIKLTNWQKKILSQIWPGKISVILNCFSNKFKYLHRGMKTLALRIPGNKELNKILKISGPLVAPSANWGSYQQATTITEARKYFQDKVFYYNKGRVVGKPSTLIDLTKKSVKVLRIGQDYAKIKKVGKIN